MIALLLGEWVVKEVVVDGQSWEGWCGVDGDRLYVVCGYAIMD